MQDWGPQPIRCTNCEQRASANSIRLTDCMVYLVLHQSPAACDPAAAAVAAEATEGGGRDLLLLLAAGSKLAAASSLLSASPLFPLVPASHCCIS